MSMDLYIYYKVSAAAAAGLAPRIRALQAALGTRHGVAAALKRRPGEQDGCQTWMEVYSKAPPGFEAMLAQAVQDGGVAELIVGGAGGRHTEIFVDMEACA
jgi:hypothetical protein